jgi:hypothetical protein
LSVAKGVSGGFCGELLVLLERSLRVVAFEQGERVSLFHQEEAATVVMYLGDRPWDQPTLKTSDSMGVLAGLGQDHDSITSGQRVERRIGPMMHRTARANGGLRREQGFDFLVDMLVMRTHLTAD